MSKAVPSKPPSQPVRRTYHVTTTSRVPGRQAEAQPAVDEPTEQPDPPIED